jgi:hypothetical protein
MTTYYRHKKFPEIIAKIEDGEYYDTFTYDGTWQHVQPCVVKSLGHPINMNKFYIISEEEAFELIITKFGKTAFEICL